MNSKRPVVHLVCTAHIDPVWMWSWEEGLREAISTFHSAVKLLDEFPAFVFNHNESLLYEWVEEIDPPLFSEICRLVRAGRWHISGGWYLQPDLNAPAGETLVRVIAEGRRYFKEKFGKRPGTAYNLDSFGHPGSLPKLLAQSGYSMYLHCRPVASQMQLPGPFYRWRGADGSEIITVRPDTGWYCTPGSGQAEQHAQNGIQAARASGQDTIVMWGLGDHGGGATRKDLLALQKIMDETTDVEVRHSTPEAFMNVLLKRQKTLPVHEGELQRTLSGTYTSVATIKRKLRAVEGLLASAERSAAAAWWLHGRDYPAEQLREAWKALLFNTFHDVTPGSLRESAIPGVMAKFGLAEDIARRVAVKALCALLPQQEPMPGTIPVFVYNPHAGEMKAPVGLNFLSAYAPPPERKAFALYDGRGRRVPHQESGSDAAVLEEGTWQPFCGFIAKVPALSVSRYEIRFEPEKPGAWKLKAEETKDSLLLETPFWQARFDRRAGTLASLIEPESGHEVLRRPARLMAMQDSSHAWGGENRVMFNEPAGEFKALQEKEVGAYAGMEGRMGPAVRVVAKGDAWLSVECLTGWQYSRASIRYTFYAELPFVDVQIRLNMQARRKMIKYQLPLNLSNCSLVAEVPYGTAAYPADSTEYPYARWLRLDGPEGAVGIANNGQNGFDASTDGVLNLSLTRGATHCSGNEGEAATDRPYTFMDQTQIDTAFRLLSPPDRSKLNEMMIPAMLTLNQPLDAFFTYTPPTPPPAIAPAAPLVEIRPSTVVLGAMKKAEQGESLIVRLAECAGRKTRARARIAGGPWKEVSLPANGIRTFSISRDMKWTEVNLLEEALN